MGRQVAALQVAARTAAIAPSVLAAGAHVPGRLLAPRLGLAVVPAAPGPG